MAILQVSRLNKRYEAFHLKDISFSLDEGFIMGFIGINGAGKTTTLKSMLNLVHADSGEVEILGKTFKEYEIVLKRELGLMFGELNYYMKKKAGSVTNSYKRFFPNWDNDAYESFCKRFSIDPEKKICDLSQGMRAKYALTLALSHHAKLFILDEPTSGLDPAARDDLLDIFQGIVEDGRRSILFSTHITSDLEKCADFITYIHEGKLVRSDSREGFLDAYRLVKGPQKLLETADRDLLIASKKHNFGFTGLIERTHLDSFLAGLSSSDTPIAVEAPSLEDIMIYYPKKEALHA